MSELRVKNRVTVIMISQYDTYVVEANQRPRKNEN